MLSSIFNKRRIIGIHYLIVLFIVSSLFIIDILSIGDIELLSEVQPNRVVFYLLNIILNPICCLIFWRNKTEQLSAYVMIFSATTLVIADLYEYASYCIRNGMVSITITSLILIYHVILLIFVITIIGRRKQPIG
jgi:hypothetical protein